MTTLVAAADENDYEALIQFLYLAPVGLIQLQMDGAVVMMNPLSAQLLMPISRDADLTNFFRTMETVAPELRFLCNGFGAQYGMVCDALRIRIDGGQASGKGAPQILSLTLLKLDDSRLMAVLVDVSMQVRREQQVKQNEAWFNAILTGVTDYAMLRLDRHGRIQAWNPGICRLTGFDRDAVQGQPYSIFYPADAMTGETLLDRLREADDNGWCLDEGYRLRADGSRFWASAMITPLPADLDGEDNRIGNAARSPEPSYCLVIRDISELQDASEAHRIASFCDHLTGIANRRAFFEAAELELARYRRAPRDVALVIFDADYFKKINDRFGHPAGDAVLKHFAGCLTATFRAIDVVARIGGEEFAVLLPSTDLEGACAVANRLRRMVQAATVVVDDVEIRYTVSGGVAAMDGSVEGLNALIKNADQALYAAKARGRNCIEASITTPAPLAESLLARLPAPPATVREQEDTLETLMQFLYRAPIGLVQMTGTGVIEMLNPMAAQLLMPAALDGDLLNLFTLLQQAAPWLRPMADKLEQSSGVICESMRIDLGPEVAAQGAPHVLSLSLLKLDGIRLMAVLGDATLESQREQVTLARELDDAAHTDMLTQLPNRTAVRDRLERLLARPTSDRGREFALLFLNCDRFKRINDTLGHEAGDMVLGTMATRLRATLRTVEALGMSQAGNQMAARIGSDEFVLILDGMRRVNDVDAVARRLLELLSVPYGEAPDQITCDVSIGIVLAGEVVGNADSVLLDASIAMSEAKRAGGARYLMFEPVMRTQAVQRGGIEMELRRGIGNGELFVMYQPVVGLDADGGTDACAGVEALVRWRHPVRGVVPPIDFIGIAEECGLICALGDFVLETACHTFVGWQRSMGAQAPRSLAVNLSRAQLTEPGLTARIRQILSESGMSAACLQLEVTESLAAQGIEMQQRLHELKAVGIKLALDDFGTGYSSLACLHLLPVDTVKIDRSFVSQADVSAHHRVLIQATVLVAHSLGMSTVAEGIETPAQAAAVRALECGKAQGYLYSRPLLAADLVRWIAAHAAAIEV